jgi:capsular polysaccharide biosynthesis protein
MEADDLIRFETLAVPVSSSYSPDDPNRSDDAVMDVPYLPDLRSRLTKPGKLADNRSILFIKRQFYQTEDGGISRTILNQEDVIACIAAQGGEVISPELMTIEAQREAFSGAGIVVAMAGSALANVIFCRPGTTIIMICQNKIVHPAYFGLMFDALGLNFLIVASEPVDGSNPHPSHLSVNVDIGVLRKAIDRGKLI